MEGGRWRSCSTIWRMTTLWAGLEPGRRAELAASFPRGNRGANEDLDRRRRGLPGIGVAPQKNCSAPLFFGHPRRNADPAKRASLLKYPQAQVCLPLESSEYW